jgi:hypothetical protein|tara:strand:- start:3279 stop:4226 length:948 start_codon:yes stop_codon:yes gene_type:complete
VKLQTQISIAKQTPNINYDSKLFLLGSCFAENIAEKLSYYKFQNQVNPLGVLFHPLAVLDLLQRAQDSTNFSEKDIFFSNGCWQSYSAHSRLNSISKIKILEQLNFAVHSTKEQIEGASHVVLTFGTAWVYTHIQSQRIVANCHKQPQKEFDKSILSIDHLNQTFESIISIIKSFNPDVTIVFSISPVRHLKDGFIENNQSKSSLIAALHPVINATSNTHYFPSFELVMDELRDYRFYKEDMVHPNQLAIDYIWEKFQASWILSATELIMKEVKRLQKGLGHKPFNSSSKAHISFLSNLTKDVNALVSKYPFMKF